MKKLISLTALCSVLLLTYCHKSTEPDIVGNVKLLGKWILIETLADPGDGSGKWQPVSKADQYLQFNADSTLETNTYTGLGGLAKYKVLNDSSINFIYNNGQTMSRYYQIKGTTLTIQGGCIEACGLRFTR